MSGRPRSKHRRVHNISLHDDEESEATINYFSPSDGGKTPEIDDHSSSDSSDLEDIFVGIRKVPTYGELAKRSATNVTKVTKCTNKNTTSKGFVPVKKTDQVTAAGSSSLSVVHKQVQDGAGPSRVATNMHMQKYLNEPSSKTATSCSSKEPSSTKTATSRSSKEPSSSKTATLWSSKEPSSTKTATSLSSKEPSSTKTATSWSSKEPSSTKTAASCSSKEPSSTKTATSWSSKEPSSKSASSIPHDVIDISSDSSDSNAVPVKPKPKKKLVQSKLYSSKLSMSAHVANANKRASFGSSSSTEDDDFVVETKVPPQSSGRGNRQFPPRSTQTKWGGSSYVERNVQNDTSRMTKGEDSSTTDQEKEDSRWTFMKGTPRVAHFGANCSESEQSSSSVLNVSRPEAGGGDLESSDTDSLEPLTQVAARDMSDFNKVISETDDDATQDPNADLGDDADDTLVNSPDPVTDQLDQLHRKTERRKSEEQIPRLETIPKDCTLSQDDSSSDSDCIIKPSQMPSSRRRVSYTKKRQTNLLSYRKKSNENDDNDTQEVVENIERRSTPPPVDTSSNVPAFNSDRQGIFSFIKKLHESSPKKPLPTVNRQESTETTSDEEPIQRSILDIIQKESHTNDPLTSLGDPKNKSRSTPTPPPSLHVKTNPYSFPSDDDSDMEVPPTSLNQGLGSARKRLRHSPVFESSKKLRTDDDVKSSCVEDVSESKKVGQEGNNQEQDVASTGKDAAEPAQAEPPKDTVSDSETQDYTVPFTKQLSKKRRLTYDTPNTDDEDDDETQDFLMPFTKKFSEPKKEPKKNLNNFSFSQQTEVYVVGSDEGEEEVDEAFAALSQSFVNIPDKEESEDEAELSDVILVDPWDPDFINNSTLGCGDGVPWDQVVVKKEKEEVDISESLYQTQKAIQEAMNTWSDDDGYLPDPDLPQSPGGGKDGDHWSDGDDDLFLSIDMAAEKPAVAENQDVMKEPVTKNQDVMKETAVRIQDVVKEAVPENQNVIKETVPENQDVIKETVAENQDVLRKAVLGKQDVTKDTVVRKIETEKNSGVGKGDLTPKGQGVLLNEGVAGKAEKLLPEQHKNQDVPQKGKTSVSYENIPLSDGEDKEVASFTTILPHGTSEKDRTTEPVTEAGNLSPVTCQYLTQILDEPMELDSQIVISDEETDVDQEPPIDDVVDSAKESADLVKSKDGSLGFSQTKTESDRLASTPKVLPSTTEISVNIKESQEITVNKIRSPDVQIVQKPKEMSVEGYTKVEFNENLTDEQLQEYLSAKFCDESPERPTTPHKETGVVLIGDDEMPPLVDLEPKDTKVSETGSGSKLSKTKASRAKEKENEKSEQLKKQSEIRDTDKTNVETHRSKSPAPKPRSESPAPKPRSESPAPKTRSESPAPKPRSKSPAPKPRSEGSAPKPRSASPAPKPKSDKTSEVKSKDKPKDRLHSSKDRSHEDKHKSKSDSKTSSSSHSRRSPARKDNESKDKSREGHSKSKSEPSTKSEKGSSSRDSHRSSKDTKSSSSSKGKTSSSSANSTSSSSKDRTKLDESSTSKSDKKEAHHEMSKTSKIISKVITKEKENVVNLDSDSDSDLEMVGSWLSVAKKTPLRTKEIPIPKPHASTAVAKFQERISGRKPAASKSKTTKKRSRRKEPEDDNLISMTQSIGNAREQMIERARKAKEERRLAAEAKASAEPKAKEKTSTTKESGAAENKKGTHQTSSKASQAKPSSRPPSRRSSADQDKPRRPSSTSSSRSSTPQPSATKNSAVQKAVDDITESLRSLSQSQLDEPTTGAAQSSSKASTSVKSDNNKTATSNGTSAVASTSSTTSGSTTTAPGSTSAAEPVTKKRRINLPMAKVCSSTVPGCYAPGVQQDPYELLKALPALTLGDSGRPLSTHDFLGVVLQWIPNWLQETDDMEGCAGPKTLPPIMAPAVQSMLLPGDDLWPVPDTFDTPKDYVQIMLGHILHETWAAVFSDWRRNKHRTFMTSLIPASLNQGEPQFNSFVFQGLTDRNQKQPFSEGDLVIVHMRTRHVLHPVFGYVEKVMKMEPRNQQQMHPKLGDFQQVRRNKRQVLNVTIRTFHRDRLFPDNDFTNVQSITSLITTLRQIDALIAITRNPLSKDLLELVRLKTFLPTDHQIDKNIEKLYNPSQTRVINAVVTSLLQPFAIPRVSLVQGPPGTGKSHTILAIIRNTIFRKTADGRTPCLMLCAPSNAAVDELVRRISLENDIRKQQGEELVRIVRMGSPASMSPGSLRYSLDTHVKDAWSKRRLLEKLQKMPMSIRKEMLQVHEQLPRLQEQLEAARKAKTADRIREIEQDIALLEKKKSKIDQSDKRNEPTGREQAQLRYEVLAHAHIVCCTLNTAGSRVLTEAVQFGQAQALNPNYKGPRLQFTGVLIDEACQCVEVEALIPLQYCSTKLVLIGDPQQLPPTVISQEAETMKFSQSLFERLFNYFRLKGHNIVHLLDTQYRMHPEIVGFPSKHVYNGRLKTHPDLARKRSLFPYRHYIVFDLAYSQEESDRRSLSVGNPSEVQFVVSLIKYLTSGTKVKPQVIGIITPYKQQRFLLLDQLRNCHLEQIDVGTVDGFQGQEKDVIIVSCVRARSSNNKIGFVADKRRMNVALTRAKYGCYVVGHLDSLKVDPDWSALIDDGLRRKAVVRVKSASVREDVIKKVCKK